MTDNVNLSLRGALDLRWRRHELLAQNVANADTPGFKPKDLEFEGILQAAIADEPQGGASRGPVTAQSVVERPRTVDTLDENSVDTDLEMARIADNNVQYQTAMEVLRRRYGMVRNVVNDLSRA